MDHPESLESVRSVLAVCAHPDDESFGLGAVIDALGRQGTATALVCLTHGEASTLGAEGDDLALRRAAELRDAGTVLGLDRLTVHRHPDGALAAVALGDLVTDVERAIAEATPDCLLVFDVGGITGHADHQQATAAALEAADRLGLPVLAWTLADGVASTLRKEFGAPFVGRSDDELDITMCVDRTLQWQAIRCHASQSTDNPVLLRRLELQGEREALVWLRRGRDSS